jgi:hypothetical protein
MWWTQDDTPDTSSPYGVWRNPQKLDEDCNELAENADCDVLADIPQGSVAQSYVFHGSLASYSCDQAYTLLGGFSRECQDGEWTGNEPECVLK